MTTFLDGPAKGTVLMLRRAPQYLRVVCDLVGKWDALDQLEDSPRPDERVIAYEMVSGPTRCHVQQRIKGRRVCGWYEGGEYREVAEQPSDDILRSNTSWRAWVIEQIGRPVNADGSVEPLAAADKPAI